ncbi:hypothetical protein [Aureimonas sp. AU40]|uniref:hypothetical protein n=1 Tax=Aureimonas sp. AU40 TaxID=1637747 RepID=UPI000782750C|nr:hypothetical protein [Aureimonas sp. AU40]
MIRTLFAATLGLSAMTASIPVMAQDSAPIPRGGRVVQVESGRPLQTQATGLPGVGLDTSSSSRNDSPRGPGGLSNGVGAYGVMAPDASGTAGNTLTRVPGAIPDTNGGIGIPLGSPGAPVR